MPGYNYPRRGTARTLPNCCVAVCIVCFVLFCVLFVCKCVLYYCHPIAVDKYRVSQEEWAKLRESVPYVKLYGYNPKHLYPKLNGYGDNDHRKVWASGGPRSLRRP